MLENSDIENFKRMGADVVHALDSLGVKVEALTGRIDTVIADRERYFDTVGAAMAASAAGTAARAAASAFTEVEESWEPTRDASIAEAMADHDRRAMGDDVPKHPHGQCLDLRCVECYPGAHGLKYSVSRCPCGHTACKDWHVDPVAALQGVKFTEKQARAVAALLNGMDADDEAETRK